MFWWQKKSLEKKYLKTKRFAFLLFSVFIVLFFISLTAKAFNQFKNRVWQENQRLNLIVDTNPLFLLSVGPQGKDLVILAIPEEAYVKVVEGKGFFKLGSVYELGDLEGKGGFLLMETTQMFLGVPVDGWVKLKDGFKADKLKVDSQEFIKLKRSLFSLSALLNLKKNYNFLKKNLKTNLTSFDLLRLSFVIKKVRFNKMKFIDLSLKGVFSDSMLADGSMVKKGDSIKIDETVKKFFLEEEIMKEAIDIEVLNGTETPGLAREAARILTNIGAKVIRIGNSEQKIKRCVLKHKQALSNSATLRKIKQIFDKCDDQELKEEKTRAQIIIILGEDFRALLFGE